MRTAAAIMLIERVRVTIYLREFECREKHKHRMSTKSSRPDVRNVPGVEGETGKCKEGRTRASMQKTERACQDEGFCIVPDAVTGCQVADGEHRLRSAV